MAAIYDPQGNYMGDDGGPTLDQMHLELARKNKLTPQQMEKAVPSQPLASQIPGYGKPVPPAQTPPSANPLEAAAGNFTTLATNFNPLMMAKSMREAAGILTVPPVAAIKGVAESLFTSPPGTYTSGKAPDYAEKVAKEFMTANAPQTPMTQSFASAIAPAMESLPAYLGHLQTGRPAFTPNDLRVMGAEATRVGRQVKDIPTDFVNAQSGLQKLDPITGQPTYGAKLQGVAEGVGDIMAQREMQGLPPIPGLPASMQPMNPKLYAMRPEGSRVTTATMPETAKQSSATYSPAYDIVSSVIDSTTITPIQALDEIQNKILAVPEAIPARKAFEKFIKQKAAEMYPDAPTPADAVNAYKARFSDRQASAAHTLGMYDEFLQTPEGLQFRVALDLPSADELPAMHEAASNWLNSQFTNYIIEKVGTPNEPAAKLASQGLTFNPPEDVFNLADMSGRAIGNKRTYAGMPAKTATDEALIVADQQLEDLRQQAADATVRKREQTQAAIAAGYGAQDGPNLGQYEPFAQASREANKATEAYKKQQKLVNNLRLGAAYENATDQAISASTAKELQNELEYSERQFYPSLMRTPDNERAYTASVRHLRNLGFEDLARKFYDDVMSRKIHLDKVPKLTVEKYIRQTAEARIDKEKKEQAAVAAYKNAVDTQFKRSTDAYVPYDKIFGNVGALEITDRFTPDEVAKLVSEDTTALDVCIGEGGTTSGRPNLWHPGTGNRQYEPIYNVATGERNPNATSPRTTYINAVRDGSQMVSFRDTVTGEPVAIFDFNPSSRTGRYNINFASGRRNGKIKPDYVEGIKSYLNSRADSIHDVGDNLYNTTGISDSERSANTKLAGMISMPISEFAKYDLSNLPRFITTPDLRNYIENLKANEPAVQTPAAMSQRPSESLNAYATGAVSSAIDNVLDSQRRAFNEIGEDNQFIQAETVFESLRNRFAEDLERRLMPELAVSSLIQRLYDLENEYANSPRIVANTIAEGIRELESNLRLQEEYLVSRRAAEAAQPNSVAQRGDPIPDNLDAEDIIGRYRDRLTIAQVTYLQDFANRWSNTVHPDDVRALETEFNTWLQNNRLLPEQAPDYLRMTHDATMQLSRQMGEEAGNEMSSAIRAITEGLGIDPARNTDQFIMALREAADDAARGTVEIAMNELADRMDSAYMQDWEPEVAPQPAARAPVIPLDFAGLVDTTADEVGQIFGNTIGDRVGTIAYRTAERTNPRLDPEGYAAALRAVDPAFEHAAVMQGLRAIADQIAPQAAAPAPMAFRTPSQAEASAIMGGIESEFDSQIEALRDAVNDNAVRLFSGTFETLLRERGLTDITMDTLPELGRALDGLRTDIAPQIAFTRTMGFEGAAVADALMNMSLAIRDRLEDLEPARQLRGADLDNQRNDRIFQLENAVNDPELNPDDLRSLANELSNPLNQAANNRWISLAEDERRDYAQALRQRANYIEFNPRDFAQRLMNEEGPEHYDDAITLLQNNDYDHEILRGLSPTERPRAAQATALEMSRLSLNEAYRRLNPNGVPPEPAMTPRQQAIAARVPQITDMLIEFSDDDPIRITADYRRVANILRDPRNAREFLENVMGVGDSLGDFTLRTTDLQRSTLSLVADELERRAEELGMQDQFEQALEYRVAAEDIVELLEENYYTNMPNPRDAIRLIRQHLRALRRNGEMAFEDILGMATTAYEWSPELLNALEVELENLAERYQGMQGNAEGGPVRGYQKGGSVKAEVKTPWLFSVPTYSDTVAYEMYPGQKGQDDQRDAARHMLAAGTLSRKYGAGPAEFLGKAHEFATSPLQAVKSLFGGKMPADYGMDTHNNRVGAQLGQKAKSQAELEDLVQEAAERASRTQTPDKAFIKKANGGIVQQNPTTDQMRYALMMRRK